MAIAKECSYLLMEDTHGEKAVGKFMSVLRGVPKLVPVLRGELLSSVSEAQEKTKYCLRKDPSITMHLDAYSVTPLDDSETHVQLLEAIEKPSDRFSVFAYKLEWGCKLRVGNQVNVRIPNENSSMPIWSLAVVKYVGEVKSLPGKNFGVEIKSARYIGRGCTDGCFQGQRYFTCGKDCGLFVALDKLSPKPGESESTISELDHLKSVVGDISVSQQKQLLEAFNKEMEDREKQVLARGIPPQLSGEQRHHYDYNGDHQLQRVQLPDPRHHPLHLPPPMRFIGANTSSREPSPDNPLHVPMVEEVDQCIMDFQMFKYVGNEKGIQGHQNSCYIDSTLFGLFALSDVFDTMFLDADLTSDDIRRVIGNLLWKGIVNPLRKNGVVRYESVMKLRNKLDELEKMEGITEKEKDPEEFLNMLFKHMLRVSPFISIRRPFGVEQEFFVQLFVEYDANLRLPTIGDLLRKMFFEQQISFTTVPSRLLIQVPRFGKQFKTYQKIVPDLKLRIRELTDTVTNVDVDTVTELDLLSVICIETSHYVCFTRDPTAEAQKWIFFDSMASLKCDTFLIPEVTDCTAALNEWVYPPNGDRTRLMSTGPRQLPELVRRFTQDVYMCVYIQPDVAMYGDKDELGFGQSRNYGISTVTALQKERSEQIAIPSVMSYVGNNKGIQGHQNSCYLDSTVFGLFALSDVIDTIFTSKDTYPLDRNSQAVGDLLRKEIICPLRKNGFVEYKFVMMLRNKLDEFGKMERITEEEKDPEEFLNMLFKRVLRVTPFLSIRRPFGVEQELFVQLFVEYDPNLRLPTIGDLLRKMFLEQQIYFTKVPSKLLIQFPRFGREFQTYRKTVPDLKLCITEMTDTFTNVDVDTVTELDLLSVICIETSHYVCFTRDPGAQKGIFFDSMASRQYDTYNIPKVTDCTAVLNEWVYPPDGDRTRLMSRQPQQLPELVRRFTQDIYMCVYIQPDVGMYGDKDELGFGQSRNYGISTVTALQKERSEQIAIPSVMSYVGNNKGIQGHQNSCCCLDSTVFGLFALSDVIDTIFTLKDTYPLDRNSQAVGDLLRKEIICPLRKNGFVRYESVMMLRNKLDELGFREREKDPEEFLNMLFKRVLQVSPFISLRRPFGVEQEFFVQLFVEYDPNLKLPTVGDLLRKMFHEQQISFTKVQSMLLIQVPRLGRNFGSYQKIVPELTLNIAELTDLYTQMPECVLCGERSSRKCPQCSSEFTSVQDAVYFCDVCSSRVHTKREHYVGHVELKEHLYLLSVICIENSHYVCFTRDPTAEAQKWIFFDSMASRKYDTYNIPKVTDCTAVLNEWVYPPNGDHTRLTSTQPRQLPELVRRFTQDVYMCVYIKPDRHLYRCCEEFEKCHTGLPRQCQAKPPLLHQPSTKASSNAVLEMERIKQENTSLLAEKANLSQAQEKLQHEILVLEQNNLQLQGLNKKLQVDLHDKSQQSPTAIQEKHQLQQQTEHQRGQLQDLQQEISVLKQERRENDTANEKVQKAYRDDCSRIFQNNLQLQGQNKKLQVDLHDKSQQLSIAIQEKQQLQQQTEQQRGQLQDLQLRLEESNAQVNESRFTKVQIPLQDQESWNVKRQEVVIREELGVGAWGSVCKGRFRGQQVAVKRAHRQILHENTIDQLKREIRIMAHVQHPNLVRLIAAVVDEKVEQCTDTPLLILELLSINLRDAYREKDLKGNVLVSIFRDVAYALHYLHEHQEPIIHRDVSAPNVLLEEIHRGIWRAKLSDFGSANLAKQCKTAAPGALIYSAPETFPPRNPEDPLPKQTRKIDVFSYGYLLAEVIAKEMPAAEKRRDMLARIQRQWKPMYDLIMVCIKHKPEDRLTMTQVLEKLNVQPQQ